MWLDHDWSKMVVVAILIHDGQCGSVKGARAQITDSRTVQSPAKFVTGLSGEGHGEYLVGVDLAEGNATLNS
jgi:hypothetical protein